MAVALVNTTPELFRMPTPTALDSFALDLFHEVSDEFSFASSTPETNQRKVGFAEHVDLIQSASPLDMIDASQMSDLWYDIFELDDFRSEVRELCRAMRARCTQGPDAKLCTFARGESARGLEQRSCLERQRRRYLTLKCVVRGQHGLDDERLAQLSLRCTKWAAELAAEEGARDFLHAYSESERVDIKRSSDEILETRRVRPRLSFPAED